MKKFRKTLSLFMVIITMFILCGNIKSVEALSPMPQEYIIVDGEAVLQSYQKNITNVVLPETVEIYGKVYPLTTIDENAFTWTSPANSIIESIKIPKNIKSINSSAFRDLSKLKKFIVDDENDFFTTIDDALYSKDKKTIIKYPQGKDSNIARVYSYAETISPYAFAGCSKLEEIKAYDGIKNIGEYAFEDCKSLKAFTVPEGITKLENGTFGYCENLEILNLPSTLQDFNHYIINGCYSLKEINIKGNNNYLVEQNGCIYNNKRDTLLWCVNISNNEEVIVPEGVTTIYDYAFASCKNLKRIILPEGLNKINAYTFLDCENLVDVNIPSTVKEIDSSAFSMCNSLESIDISDGVEKMGNYIFSQCEKLEYIKIPDSVKEIGHNLISEDSTTKIVCNKNSYAEEYAKENNIEVQYVNDDNQCLRVYYHNLAGWDAVNMYAYDEEYNELLGSWPGQKMEDKGNGWWYYEIPSVQSARVMFNCPNSLEQDPQQAIPGYLSSGTVMIENGEVINIDNVPTEKDELKRVKVVYMSLDRHEEIADSITLLGKQGEEYTAPAEEYLGIIGEHRLAGYYISTDNQSLESRLVYDNLMSGLYSGNFTGEEITIYYVYEEAIGGNCWDFQKLSINKQSPQLLGETLNVAFYIVGGIPEKSEYRLSYKMEGDNEWTLIKEYSYRDSNSFDKYNVDWKPEKAGKYILKADVLGIDGYKRTLEKEFVIEDTKILEIKEFKADKVSPQPAGTKIVLTANASGKGQLQYKFLMRNEKNNWYVMQNYSTSNTIVWNAGVSGNKNLYVDVKDESGKVVRKSIDYTINPVELEIKEFKADKVSPQPAGTKIVLTANASGKGKLQYKFLMRNEKNNWYVMQNYSTSNTMVWNAGVSGNKNLYVDVKDESGKVVRKSLDYTINPVPLVINKFSANLLLPQPAGTPITLTADASGEGILQYKFSVSDEKNNWYTIRDYSTSNTVVLNAKVPGKKKLYVDVKDGNGNILRKSIEYVII